MCNDDKIHVVYISALRKGKFFFLLIKYISLSFIASTYFCCFTFHLYFCILSYIFIVFSSVSLFFNVKCFICWCITLNNNCFFILHHVLHPFLHYMLSYIWMVLNINLVVSFLFFKLSCIVNFEMILYTRTI